MSLIKFLMPDNHFLLLKFLIAKVSILTQCNFTCNRTENMNIIRTKLNKISRLMGVWLPQSAMKEDPDPSEASSAKGAFRLGVGLEEMKACCCQEIEKRRALC